MMGEIYEIDGELNEDCGITPRIFEYLFTRIRVVGYLTFYCFTTELLMSCSLLFSFCSSPL